MDNLVELSGLTFGYRRKSPLFKDLDLNLAPGHIYGMFGKNGTGKTTLLKQMTGLLFPDKGESNIFGQPAYKRNPSTLKDIFLLPENFDLPPLSAETFRNLHAPFYPNFDHEQFDNFLKEFDFPPDQKLTKLSYGQQKKALLSFALAARTKVLLMDEPTNGLDIPSKSQFRRILARSVSEQQVVLISTHQVRDLASLIDQVIVLENGQIIFREDIDTINRTLTFQEIKDGEEANALYTEPSFAGQKAILANHDEETEIDLELLFNGILTNHETIQEHFKK